MHIILIFNKESTPRVTLHSFISVHIASIKTLSHYRNPTLHKLHTTCTSRATYKHYDTGPTMELPPKMCLPKLLKAHTHLHGNHKQHHRQPYYQQYMLFTQDYTYPPSKAQYTNLHKKPICWNPPNPIKTQNKIKLLLCTLTHLALWPGPLCNFPDPTQQSYILPTANHQVAKHNPSSDPQPQTTNNKHFHTPQTTINIKKKWKSQHQKTSNYNFTFKVSQSSHAPANHTTPPPYTEQHTITSKNSLHQLRQHTHTTPTTHIYKSATTEVFGRH